MSADSIFDAPLPERCFIAEGLMRPTLERINDGTEVFIVAKVDDGRPSFLCGEPSIRVTVGRLGSGFVGTSAPLSCVTLASGYALKEDLGYAERRAQVAEQQIADIRAILDAAGDLIDIGRIRAIVYPPSEPEDDDA